jgi:hypothetical protein
MRGRLWIPLVTVTLAGCGASSVGSTATTGNSPADLSNCMRANGISNFPDPRAGPSGAVGLPISTTPGSGTLTVEGVTFSGPAFEKAETACKAYLPGAGGPPPPVSASDKAKALAFAKCMRAHGVPNFPDPKFSGGAADKQAPPVNLNAPAVRRAAASCGGSGRIVIKG